VARPGGNPKGFERRGEARRAVDASAAIHLLRSGSKLSARLVDLSKRGCRIRCDARCLLDIHTRVEPEFILDGLPFRLTGVIQAVLGPQTAGIRFLDVSERKRAQLEQLIRDLDEGRRKEAAGRLPEL
jgi:c-di-GMP-binding flagellar brake protein YcgR